MKKTCVVYGLYSSGAPDDLRYVGQTVTKLGYRMHRHMSDARRPRTPVHFWIRREMDGGRYIEPRVLCEDAVFNQTERECIAKYRALGARLLNVTDGGAGQLGFVQSKSHILARAIAKTGKPLSAEHRRKLSVAHSGKHLSDAHKKNIAASLAGRSLTREHAAKIGASNKGRSHPVSEETKRRIGAFHLGKPKSSEQRAKMSMSAKARWAKRGEDQHAA